MFEQRHLLCAHVDAVDRDRQPNPDGRRRGFRAGDAAAVLLAGLLAMACGDRGSSQTDVPTTSMEAAFTWVRSFRLEENPDVINVSPAVKLDPEGGFLVADFREAQIRRYAPDGSLVWHAGSKGAGPGEFEVATQAVRLPSGEILASDFNGRLTIFTPRADSVARTIETPFRRVEDLDVVDDSLVLVSAILGAGFDTPRLHLWDARSGRIVRSFFSPFASSINPTAAAVASWSRASVRGDTIAAIFAVTDTVYFFTLGGERTGAVSLPTSHFRRVGRDAPASDVDPVTRAQWLGSFDYVSDVHWLSGGDLVVVYSSIDPGHALARHWHLLKMTRGGEFLLEVRDIPRLLAVDSRTDSLYLVARNAEVPNQWAVARFR